MPTYIDHLVTDIVPRGESAAENGEASGEANGDPRWQQAEQLQARLKRLERQERRVSAEGFDD